MFGFFNRSSTQTFPQTRFEQCSDFIELRIQLEKLREKEFELKTASEMKGAGSIDYAKHVILSPMLRDFDRCIAKFNNLADPIDSNKRIEEMLLFIEALGKIIHDVFNTKIEIFKQPRNQEKEMVKKALTAGGASLALTTALACSFSTLGILATLFGGTSITSVFIKNYPILNDKETATVKMLKNLIHILSAISNNLCLALDCQKQKETETAYYADYEANAGCKNFDDFEDLEDFFLCPITHEKIINPVICTLEGDGHTYEKSALEKWLIEHRTSPMSRAPVPNNVDINNFISPNRQYQGLLDAMASRHPTPHISNENNEPSAPTFSP